MNIDVMLKIQIQTANKLKILFFILVSLNSFSQSLNEIKDKDTIFIYFKNESKYEKKEIYDQMKVKRFNRISYLFIKDNYNTIFFDSREFKDYDSYINGIKNDVKIMKKSF